MKKSPLIISALCIWAVLGSLGQAFAQSSVQLCYEDQDYPPYLSADSGQPTGKDPGVLVELVQKAFEKAGLSVSFVRRPWKRCMRMVQDNEVAGMFGVVYVKIRENVGKYPMRDGEVDAEKRLLDVEYPIFRNVSVDPGWDGTAFANREVRLGTPLGYAMADSLKEEHQIVANTSFLPDVGLNLVAQKRLDGYIVEKNVGMSLLRKLDISDKVIIHQPPYKKHNLYLLLSHGFYNTDPKTAEGVWAQVAHLRKTESAKLMKRYLAK